MKDTSPQMETKFRRMLMKRSGEDRLKMGCSMHATARALVIASIPKKDAVTVNRMLFLRFYGHEFEPEVRKKILRSLRNSAKPHKKRAKPRVLFEPPKAANHMHVAEPPEPYRRKRATTKRKQSGSGP